MSFWALLWIGVWVYLLGIVFPAEGDMLRAALDKRWWQW